MDLAVPALGYKNHVGIDRRHRPNDLVTGSGPSRTRNPTANLISKAKVAAMCSSNTAYRSRANERLLARTGRRSQIHRKKPPRKPMPKLTARAKSEEVAAVEHLFAHEKGPMGLVVRTDGLAKTPVKIRTCQPRLDIEANDLGSPAVSPGVAGLQRPSGFDNTHRRQSNKRPALASADKPTPPTRHDKVLWRCPRSPYIGGPLTPDVHDGVACYLHELLPRHVSEKRRLIYLCSCSSVRSSVRRQAGQFPP